MSNLVYGIDDNDAWGIRTPGYTNQYNENSIPAFFNLEDLDDDEAVGEWMENAIESLKFSNMEFARKCVENLLFYKGVQEHYQGTLASLYSLVDASRYYQADDISINIIYEFVETWVNRIGEFDPKIVVTPTNNDPVARDNAEAKSIAIKDYFFKHKINRILEQWDRHTFIFGEGYIYVSWDADMGELHPLFNKLDKKFKAFRRIKTASGEEVNINRLPRIGDVRVEIVPPTNVLFENKPFEKLDYILVNVPTHIDKLRSDYPDVDLDKADGEVACWNMYYLPSKYLQKGRYVKYAQGKVLENSDFPYSKPIFPVIRNTNIDIIGSARAKSFIENIKPHQLILNKSISSTWQNIKRGLKGKWVVQAKSVNPMHLAPDSPAVEYIGGAMPQFVTYPTIKQETISFIELIRDYAEKQARIQGILNGEPPPNVRSGLQFAQLEERERKAVKTPIEKRNEGVEKLAEVISLFMATYYDPADGRTVTLFGKDKEYLTQALKVDALKEDHAVRVENNDSVPTGVISQLNFYTELREKTNPQVVPDELLIDMLDSGRFNQYTEFAGATVETTLAQIGMAIKEEQPPAPEEFEDLVLKWKILVGTMRKRTYMTFSDKTKEILKDMVLAVETMIMEKIESGKATESLMANVQALPTFPVYYKPLELTDLPEEQQEDTGVLPPQSTIPTNQPTEASVSPVAPLQPEDVLPQEQELPVNGLPQQLPPQGG